MKFTCYICGHKTLHVRRDWDICPVCAWEDDVILRDSEDDDSSPSNHGMFVSEAQANFMFYGASSKRRREFVEPPEPDEPLDPDWKPMLKALELFEKLKKECDS